jgi:hypothetical protein
VPLWNGCKPFIEIPEHELIFHFVMRADLDVILEPFEKP